ncbi:MAG: inosine/xanthosine triphosphatase [Archaeoglobus sp.]|uniref:inosine/xanthosine triphosphatase n=1 Tax=Archaeoglobus sp. TaxID=1872626 RepID=UPI001D853ABE|nr:inosine/xanthosine triphosphatase [Archaeoglobus sp.]MBO8179008.1 inosine/xanthosine triphosphatase [Archaeoglobus sp.]
MIRVVVGSKNPTKIEGTKMAFKQYFDEIEVVGVEVNTDVPPQPFNSETIRGAIERAKKSYSPKFDFSVGIEAGLFRFDYTISGYLDFQVAAVYDGEKCTIGFGPGFEYPKSVVKEVMEGKEVGEVMERVSGIKNLGRKWGAVHYLSKGAISRTELSRISVTMALIPLLNREMYL